MGLWSPDVSAAELKERIGADARLNFATTLMEALAHVERLTLVPALRRSDPVAIG
jgi:hypothetical protein